VQKDFCNNSCQELPYAVQQAAIGYSITSSASARD